MLPVAKHPFVILPALLVLVQYPERDTDIGGDKQFPLVFNQMIAFVQSAEVERFADRFYANPDSQYLTVVASPQDQAVVVYEGIDFFDSYQREHKGDEK